MNSSQLDYNKTNGKEYHYSLLTIYTASSSRNNCLTFISCRFEAKHVYLFSFSSCTLRIVLIIIYICPLKP